MMDCFATTEYIEMKTLCSENAWRGSTTVNLDPRVGHYCRFYNSERRLQLFGEEQESQSQSQSKSLPDPKL